MTDEEQDRRNLVAAELVAELLAQQVPEETARQLHAAALDEKLAEECFLALAFRPLPGSDEVRPFYQAGRIGFGGDTPADGFAGAGSRVFSVQHLMGRVSEKLDLLEQAGEDMVDFYFSTVGGGLFK